MGVKAFDLLKAENFGTMVSFKNNDLTAVTLKEAVAEYNFVELDHYLIKTARSLGISFGD